MIFRQIPSRIRTSLHGKALRVKALRGKASFDGGKGATIALEHRPLFESAGWWVGKKRSLVVSANLRGVPKNVFFMVGKSKFWAFRNFFHKWAS